MKIRLVCYTGGKLDARGVSSVVKTLGCFLVELAGLLVMSAEMTGSWQYINSTYGFFLTVPELTPNMGIFW